MRSKSSGHKSLAQAMKERTLYWGPERNAKRRKEYAANAEKRKQIRDANKESYRNHADVALKDFTHRLDSLYKYGAIRRVTVEGETLERLSFSVKEFASIFDYGEGAIQHWFRGGLLMRPVVTSRNNVLREGTAKRLYPIRVYLLEEVKAILEPLFDHFLVKAYLTHLDTGVLLAINTGLLKARKSLGISEATTTKPIPRVIPVNLHP